LQRKREQKQVFWQQKDLDSDLSSDSLRPRFTPDVIEMSSLPKIGKIQVATP
jgi:hypothetical protein